MVWFGVDRPDNPMCSRTSGADVSCDGALPRCPEAVRGLDPGSRAQPRGVRSAGYRCQVSAKTISQTVALWWHCAIQNGWVGAVRSRSCRARTSRQRVRAFRRAPAPHRPRPRHAVATRCFAQAGFSPPTSINGLVATTGTYVLTGWRAGLRRRTVATPRRTSGTRSPPRTAGTPGLPPPVQPPRLHRPR
jgi:hypothetical protein